MISDGVRSCVRRQIDQLQHAAYMNGRHVLRCRDVLSGRHLVAVELAPRPPRLGNRRQDAN
jgi:hypothetical protein